MIDKKKYYNQKSLSYKDLDKEGVLRYQKAVQLVEFSSNQKVLDIGCKKSILYDLIPKDKIDYFGIDISDNVSKAELNASNFKVADVDKGIPFDNNVFDFVFCLELLEHVENPTFVLKEINRILKPNGTLILSIPNPYCWFEIVINLFSKLPPGSEGHISSWTKQTFNALAKSTNFKINNYQGTFCRIPFTSRFSKNNDYIIFSNNSLFLSRSLIFKLSKE